MIGERIFSGSRYEDFASYARAVILPDPWGDWVLISGTTGYDYATMTIAQDAGSQARQCLANIEAALREAGVGPENVVRIRIFLARREDFAAVAEEIAVFCAPSRPANTTVIAPLVDEAMLVEMEVCARSLPGHSGKPGEVV